MRDRPQSAPAHSLDVASLGRKKETRVSVELTEHERATLMQDLDLLALRKVSFKASMSPVGARDWQLQARLGATALQACVVTLEPVTTRIDADVRRRFVATLPEPFEEASEDEGTPMLEDDTLELLGTRIDLLAVLREALALELPDYPRATGADLGTAVFTEPGKAAMTDADARPFAGLGALKDQLSGKSSDTDT